MQCLISAQILQNIHSPINASPRRYNAAEPLRRNGVAVTPVTHRYKARRGEYDFLLHLESGGPERMPQLDNIASGEITLRVRDGLVFLGREDDTSILQLDDGDELELLQSGFNFEDNEQASELSSSPVVDL